MISAGEHTFARSIPWMIAEAIFPAPKNAYFMGITIALLEHEREGRFSVRMRAILVHNWPHG
jgi:hypothetical protein